MKSLSRVQLSATPWTVAHQAPPSMGFSRQEYWSGLPFPSPGDLPNPGIKPRSAALQANALTSEPPGKPMGNLYSEAQNLAGRNFNDSLYPTCHLPFPLMSITRQYIFFPQLCLCCLRDSTDAFVG